MVHFERFGTEHSESLAHTCRAGPTVCLRRDFLWRLILRPSHTVKERPGTRIFFCPQVNRASMNTKNNKGTGSNILIRNFRWHEVSPVLRICLGPVPPLHKQLGIHTGMASPGGRGSSGNWQLSGVLFNVEFHTDTTCVWDGDGALWTYGGLPGNGARVPDAERWVRGCWVDISVS